MTTHVEYRSDTGFTSLTLDRAGVTVLLALELPEVWTLVREVKYAWAGISVKPDSHARTNCNGVRRVRAVAKPNGEALVLWYDDYTHSSFSLDSHADANVLDEALLALLQAGEDADEILQLKYL